MAERRMFAKNIIDSDVFLDMPLSAQALYFHLSMRADDDGFINNPKRIQRMVGASDDDCKLLIMKKFIITFDSGVIVIKDWKIHNSIQKDRYKPTIYQNEKTQLIEEEDKSYTKCFQTVSNLDTKCIQNVSKMDTQDRLGKDRLDKVSIDTLSTCVDDCNALDYQAVINSFNSICLSLPKVQKLTATRKNKIKSTSKFLGELTFEDVFCMVESSDFLSGRSGKWTGCSFDWILKPSNLVKIVEGNYNNKVEAEDKTRDKTSYDIDEFENYSMFD